MNNENHELAGLLARLERVVMLSAVFVAVPLWVLVGLWALSN